LPSAEEAVKLYEDAGGHLTHFSLFGEDPFVENISLQRERLRVFQQKYPAFNPIFHKLENGDDNLFCEAILFFIHLSITLS